MNSDYHQSPAWQRSLDVAAAVYELVEALKGPAGGRLATQLTTAAARLPARIAQAGGALSPDAEGVLLEIEALLLLTVRLGAVSKTRADAVLVEIGGLHSYAPAPVTPRAKVEVPPADVTEPAAATPTETKPQPPKAVPPALRRPTPAPSSPPPRVGVDRLLIDGHNFLGRADGFMLGSDASRDQFVLRLQEYAKKHPSHRVTVFFDGNRNSIEEKAGVEVRFSSGDGSADEAIVNFAYALPEADRKRSQLVTDDRQLADRARNAGVRRQPVSWLEELIGRKKPAPIQPRPETVSKESLGEWEQFFSRPPQRPGRK